MALFEIYVTLSITLAFGIPTFFEKVMRSGYERRVESFKESIIKEYQESLKNAVTELEEAEELTDEVIEGMDEVTDAWVDVRSNYMKLKNLLNYRNYLFVGWMLSVVVSSLAIYVHEFNTLPLNIPLNWIYLAPLIFYFMLVATTWYGWKLFEFDRELLKFSKTEKEEGIRLKPSIRFREMMKTGEDVRNRVVNVLKESSIPFEVECKIDRFRYDIIIPNIKKPQFFVEIKYVSRPETLMTFDSVARMFGVTKNKYPDSKTILLVNMKNLSHRAKEETNRYADKAFDLDNLQDFIEFVKEGITK